MNSHSNTSPEKPTAKTGATSTGQSVQRQTAELLRSNEELRGRLEQVLRDNSELVERLHATANTIQIDRQTRRAALNLMEDAIEARQQAQGSNAELLKKISELQSAEEALRIKERERQQALERYQQLTVELDQRVRDRTRDLAEREERLRELTAQLTRVEQEERQRLARLLHDHVQQLLLAAKLRIDLVSSGAPESIQHKLAGVLTMLNDALDATRDLSVQLTPPLLHDQGLPAALEWLLGRMSAMHQLRIDARLDPEANPACPQVRDILFHAAHELLLNVVKHSGTVQAHVTLTVDGGNFVLRIVDRGIGFSQSSAGGRNSFGLLQIRQRLEANGGQLDIDSTSGQGTRITARLPMVASSH